MRIPIKIEKLQQFKDGLSYLLQSNNIEYSSGEKPLLTVKDNFILLSNEFKSSLTDNQLIELNNLIDKLKS